MSIVIMVALLEADQPYLPLLHIILLPLVLLNQLVQNFPQSFRICFKGRSDVFHRLFNQDSINHSKALAVVGKGSQCL